MQFQILVLSKAMQICSFICDTYIRNSIIVNIQCNGNFKLTNLVQYDWKDPFSNYFASLFSNIRGNGFKQLYVNYIQGCIQLDTSNFLTSGAVFVSKCQKPLEINYLQLMSKLRPSIQSNMNHFSYQLVPNLEMVFKNLMIASKLINCLV